jgi:hypothetical protein
VDGAYPLVTIDDYPALAVAHHDDRRLLAHLRERRQQPTLAPSAACPQRLVTPI